MECWSRGVLGRGDRARGKRGDLEPIMMGGDLLISTVESSMDMECRSPLQRAINEPHMPQIKHIALWRGLLHVLSTVLISLSLP